MLASIFLPVLSLLSFAAAQTSTATAASTSPSEASSDAAPGAGSHGYTYVGCYNETTGISGGGGARALANGKMISNSTQTTETCLAYCSAASMQYAGLEYGQECWCSPYLNSLSTALNASACNIACLGNSSEVCGGSLRISLYNLTEKAAAAKTGAAPATAPAVGRVVAGAGVLAAVLGAAL
ncbi:hypothetical protein MBLNU459_g4478t1 [Dothideomycetes sp. NU459]